MIQFLFILFLFPLLAQAGLAIEPYAGGGLAYFGEMRSGFSIGSRIGYKKFGFTSGIDAGYSQFYIFDLSQEAARTICENRTDSIGIAKIDIPFCDKNTEQNPVSVYNIISAGPSVSFDLPLILSAYASITWSWVDKKIDNREKSFPLSGPGVKVGMSYLSLPFLQLNIEAQALILSCGSMDEKCQEQNNIPNPVLMGMPISASPLIQDGSSLSSYIFSKIKLMRKRIDQTISPISCLLFSSASSNSI